MEKRLQVRDYEDSSWYLIDGPKLSWNFARYVAADGTVLKTGSWDGSRFVDAPSSTPQTGAVWKAGQRRRGDIPDLPLRGVEYVVIGKHTGSEEYQWQVRVDAAEPARHIGREYGVCEDWPSTLLEPAPTPKPAIAVPLASQTFKNPPGQWTFAGPPKYPIGEMRDGDKPLSALQAIKARQTLAPWVPSITDEDLLPDA